MRGDVAGSVPLRPGVGGRGVCPWSCSGFSWKGWLMAMDELAGLHWLLWVAGGRPFVSSTFDYYVLPRMGKEERYACLWGILHGRLHTIGEEGD